ncbi:ABC transporter ATP-binding protein/permease [Nonomuraea salmonea]|uniref:ABC transporter ATP-binding protein/permease n=1 Tax=Nonomuraea salmonea TaxID=46181 RepID=UPI002FE86583
MIETRSLSKTFDNGVHAVDGVDMTVRPGEIVGFLGPNGAGKTTTMRMLTTLLRPTGGPPPWPATTSYASRARCAAASATSPRAAACHPSPPIRGELEVQGMLYGLSRADAAARIPGVLERLDLAGLADQAPATLSGGRRRRFDIAFALLHDPVLLFLDEPTTGLDPQSRANLWDHIRSLRDRQGMTVFLTTHYLDEADALCDRVMIIDRGRIVAQGAPAELKTGGRTLDDVFLDITGRSLREENATIGQGGHDAARHLGAVPPRTGRDAGTADRHRHRGDPAAAVPRAVRARLRHHRHLGDAGPRADRAARADERGHGRVRDRLRQARGGVLERLRVTPASRLALLLGRVLNNVVTLVLQTVLLLAVAYAFGLRAPLAGVLGSFVLVVVLGASLAALSYAIALTIDEHLFPPVMTTAVVPLVLLSGSFLPMSMAPGWLDALSHVSPFRYVLEALRDLFHGHYLTGTVAAGAAVTVAFAVFSLTIGTRVFNREQA